MDRVMTLLLLYIPVCPCKSLVYFRIPQGKPILPRVSKSGNSLAVRIPKELAFVEGAQNIDMERVGNTLMLRPVVRPVVQVTIGDLTLTLSMVSLNFMAAGREFHEQSERDWSGNSPGLLMQALDRPSPRHRVGL
jgi:antitoxin VapB